MLKNLKLSTKLFVSFGMVLLLIIILGTFSLFSAQRLSNIAQQYEEKTVPSVGNLWELRRNILSIERHALQTIVINNAEQLNKVIDAIYKEEREIDDLFQNMNALMPDYQADLSKMYEESKALVEHGNQIIAKSALLSPEGDAEAYSYYEQNFLPVFNSIASQAMKLTNTLEDSIQMQADRAQTTKQNVIFLVSILLVIAVASTIFITISLTRLVTSPVSQIRLAMQKLAQGKLNEIEIAYQAKDELGIMADTTRTMVESMKTMIFDLSNNLIKISQGDFQSRCENKEAFVGDFKPLLDATETISVYLNDTLLQINTASDQVSAGADQVSAGAQALSQGATQQASSVQELSATLNDISQQVTQNAENAAQAQTEAERANQEVQNSNHQMLNMISAMKDISGKSDQIGKIIKTIEDIAFQTNILALNAAVEAARAGTAGKGFAVVAGEVRNLAQKSSEAAKDTTLLIEDTIRSVEHGVSIADDTAHSMKEVVQDVGNALSLIGEIAQASKQQATSIEQVTFGIEQISSVVQTNSATAEQSAAASEELSGQASLMKQLVASFELSNHISQQPQENFA